MGCVCSICAHNASDAEPLVNGKEDNITEHNDHPSYNSVDISPNSLVSPENGSSKLKLPVDNRLDQDKIPPSAPNTSSNNITKPTEVTLTTNDNNSENAENQPSPATINGNQLNEIEDKTDAKDEDTPPIKLNELDEKQDAKPKEEENISNQPDQILLNDNSDKLHEINTNLNQPESSQIEQNTEEISTLVKEEEKPTEDKLLDLSEEPPKDQVEKTEQKDSSKENGEDSQSIETISIEAIEEVKDDKIAITPEATETDQELKETKPEESTDISEKA